MSRRRSNSSVTDFLSDITDDIKDFLDDEVLDRGRDTERDVRRSGRRWVDSDDDRRSSGRGDDDLDELREAVAMLSKVVDGLAERQKASAPAGNHLPIAGYDELTAAQVVAKLPGLSQADLAEVDAYEQANANRSTITSRVESLRGDEPWSGYDGQNVTDIRQVLSDADEALVGEVRAYETRHKNRQGVLDATSVAATSS